MKHRNSSSKPLRRSGGQKARDRNENGANEGLTGKPHPARGPKPSLTVIQIAAAAIRVADASGIEAVTMQRVAKETGVTTMALYRYFPGKSDLISLMIDTASTWTPSVDSRSAPWDSRLKTWARRCLAIYREHPWFLQATSTRDRRMGPRELLWLEAALEMLNEAGLPAAQRFPAFLVLIAHIRGFATFQQIEDRDEAARSWKRDLVELLRRDAARYPALLESLDSGGFAKGSAHAFELGLDSILAGIRWRLGAKDKQYARRRIQ